MKNGNSLNFFYVEYLILINHVRWFVGPELTLQIIVMTIKSGFSLFPRRSALTTFMRVNPHISKGGLDWVEENCATAIYCI